MLLGYSIPAVPTGIITAELHQEMSALRALVKCPNSEFSLSGHESDALFCKHCVESKLADPDKQVVPLYVLNTLKTVEFALPLNSVKMRREHHSISKSYLTDTVAPSKLWSER